MHHNKPGAGQPGAGQPLRAVSFDATHTLFHSPRLVSIYLEVMQRHYGTAAVSAAELGRLLPLVWQEFACAAIPSADRFTHHDFTGHEPGSKGFWSRYAERICEYLGLTASPFAAAELFDRFAHAEAWEVYPDVEETLLELRRRGLLLAIISNWDDRLPVLLEDLRLLRYFDTVVFSAECGVEKPHAEIFDTCVGRLGVARPQQVLHVGDSQREDVEGAVAAGLKALRIDRRSRTVHLLDLLSPELPADRCDVVDSQSNLFLLDSEGSRVRT